MFHYRKNVKHKNKLLQVTGCPFCLQGERKVLEVTELSYVTASDAPYDLWELREVTEHLLIIPKRHVTSFAELNDAERTDIMQLMTKYEAAGYSIYARAPSNKQRTVEHQHTHLFKTKDKQAHGSLTIIKPHVLIKF